MKKISKCQVCDSCDLEEVIFLGYMPPVNDMPRVGEVLKEQKSYPVQLLFCRKCLLGQLGISLGPSILFPPDYPYTSGTTQILRNNFKDLCGEVCARFPTAIRSLVIDIGSNDGTLLKCFRDVGFQVLGIEPTNSAKLAVKNGIPTHQRFFNLRNVRDMAVKAKIVTATNVFAHTEDVHETIRCVLEILDDDGIFITESHYFLDLLDKIQFDTIYHEHLRYYTLTSLQAVFHQHGLNIIHWKRIPTHGGSIRVYASRHKGGGDHDRQIEEEKEYFLKENFRHFRRMVTLTKLDLLSCLSRIYCGGGRIYGIGAPSRASVLINYMGIDSEIMERVVEVPDSVKIGRYIPGTRIPVVDESCLIKDQPGHALLLSHHISGELKVKLKAKGFGGKCLNPFFPYADSTSGENCDYP